MNGPLLGTSIPTLVYAGTRWLAYNGTAPYNRAYTSTNGIDFTTVTLPTSTVSLVYVTVVNNVFYARSADEGGVSFLVRSPDGVTWTNVHPAPSSTNSLDIIRGAGSRVIAIAGAVVYVSADSGITWSAVTYGTSSRAVGGPFTPMNVATPSAMLELAGSLYWMNANWQLFRYDGANLTSELVYNQSTNAVEAPASSTYWMMPLGSNAFIMFRSDIATSIPFFIKKLGQPAYSYVAAPALALTGSPTWMTDGLRIAGVGSTTSVVEWGNLHQFNTATEFAVPLLPTSETSASAYIKAA
jgi:hypothetical protein